MEEFVFGIILGAVVTACAMTKSVREGFGKLFSMLWERIDHKVFYIILALLALVIALALTSCDALKPLAV